MPNPPKPIRQFLKEETGYDFDAIKRKDDVSTEEVAATPANPPQRTKDGKIRKTFKDFKALKAYARAHGTRRIKRESSVLDKLVVITPTAEERVMRSRRIEMEKARISAMKDHELEEQAKEELRRKRKPPRER
jgi:hypothetical protein